MQAKRYEASTYLYSATVWMCIYSNAPIILPAHTYMCIHNLRFEKLVSTLDLETVKVVWDKMCYNKQVRLCTVYVCMYVCIYGLYTRLYALYVLICVYWHKYALVITYFTVLK